MRTAVIENLFYEKRKDHAEHHLGMNVLCLSHHPRCLSIFNINAVAQFTRLKVHPSPVNASLPGCID